MSNLNKVLLMGRLGSDPETVTFNNGGKICKFSLATSEHWKDKETGEKKSKTEWINVVIQGHAVSIVEQYVRKGHLLFVEGKIVTRTWEKDGQKYYATEVVSSAVQLMPNKNEGQTENTAKASYNPPKSEAVKDASQFDEADDDLPF